MEERQTERFDVELLRERQIANFERDMAHVGDLHGTATRVSVGDRVAVPNREFDDVAVGIAQPQTFADAETGGQCGAGAAEIFNSAQPFRQLGQRAVRYREADARHRA